MKRFQDWPSKLEGYIRSVSIKPFEWGAFDCALFACSCVEVMTGVDPAKELRGGYKNKREAAEALRRYSGSGLEKTAEKIARMMCMEEVAPGLAGRGDVVLVKTEIGKCLGIVDLNGREIVITDFDGLSRHPLTLATRAWRV